MAATVRSRQIGASAEAIWAVVNDPHHLPRWWPRVARVEDVSRDRFTEVVPAKSGKPMRVDFRIVESIPGALVSWTQELPGTPFERLVSEWSTTVALAPAKDRDATVVTITELQRLRGSFRPGRPLQWRPARRRLDGALDGLARIIG